MLLPLLLACASLHLTCREPDVSSFTAEGVPDALCDVTFSACEDGDYLTVSCSNDTFSGDYDCTYLWIRDTHTASGQFSSPDFCTQDTAGMVDALRDAGVDVAVE